MKEQYVIRKYWTPNDGELISNEDNREIVLSSLEYKSIVGIIEIVEDNRPAFKKLREKLDKLTTVNL